MILFFLCNRLFTLVSVCLMFRVNLPISFLSLSTIKSDFQLLVELGICLYFTEKIFIFIKIIFELSLWFMNCCFSGGFFKREGKAKDHEVRITIFEDYLWYNCYFFNILFSC